MLGGGTCTYNPEPLADFFDAFLIGEGEEALGEILDSYARWQQKHPNRLARTSSDRQELLRELTAIPGLYVPSLYETEETDEGLLIPRPTAPEATPTVARSRENASMSDGSGRPITSPARTAAQNVAHDPAMPPSDTFLSKDRIRPNRPGCLVGDSSRRCSRS